MEEGTTPGAAHVFISMLSDMVRVGGNSQGRKDGTKQGVWYDLMGRRITSQVCLEGVIERVQQKSSSSSSSSLKEGGYVLNDGTGSLPFTLSKICRFDHSRFKIGDPYALVGKWKKNSKCVNVTHVYPLPGTSESNKALWESRVRHIWGLNK